MVFWPAVARAADAWNPAWNGIVPPGSLPTLGAAHVGLAVLGGLAVIVLWRRTRGIGLRRALTWDCGYAEPTPRMQYTAGSFAGTITEWFAWILRPQTHDQRPEGLFPAAAAYGQHTPETVLEQIVEPAAGAVMRFSTIMRRLQHGRLQSYLLYLVVGIAALAGLVLAGEWQ